jgi:serine/threonine-protein kinase RsbW
MTDEIRLSMANTFEDLARLMADAELFLQSHGLPPRTVYDVNLVLEEVLTNIVKYGFDDEATHEIQLIVTITDSGVTIKCEDDGREFDPLAALPPDIEGRDSILELTEGGLGIHLVRQTVQSMEYSREEHKNVLTMTIK